MHTSETVRFKISLPSDTALEFQIIDAIEIVEGVKQWVGSRPAGYLEVKAQEMLKE